MAGMRTFSNPSFLLSTLNDSLRGGVSIEKEKFSAKLHDFSVNVWEETTVKRISFSSKPTKNLALPNYFLMFGTGLERKQIRRRIISPQRE